MGSDDREIGNATDCGGNAFRGDKHFVGGGGIEVQVRFHLLQAMSEDPLASANPRYRNKKEHLRYKLLIKGVMRVIPLERIRYVAKSGRAYGTMAFRQNGRSERDLSGSEWGIASAAALMCLQASVRGRSLRRVPRRAKRCSAS